eukprot:2313505-Lingulodinium_polyedra.AAC.1
MQLNRRGGIRSGPRLPAAAVDERNGALRASAAAEAASKVQPAAGGEGAQAPGPAGPPAGNRT